MLYDDSHHIRDFNDFIKKVTILSKNAKNGHFYVIYLDQNGPFDIGPKWACAGSKMSRGNPIFGVQSRFSHIALAGNSLEKSIFFQKVVSFFEVRQGQFA